ncbi:MAG: hypothetical protein L3J79_03885, partial [Candidatus Marinimicrobia bacterium]|nr:hypothetical protein [Candidatus Neomarinimicrobiota bacterium]
MIVRISQKLKKTLGLSTGPVPKTLELGLWEWTADWFHVAEEDLIIFVSSSTHLVVVCPLKEPNNKLELFPPSPVHQIEELFRTRLNNLLIALGVDKDQVAEASLPDDDI